MTAATLLKRFYTFLHYYFCFIQFTKFVTWLLKRVEQLKVSKFHKLLGATWQLHHNWVKEFIRVWMWKIKILYPQLEPRFCKIIVKQPKVFLRAYLLFSSWYISIADDGEANTSRWVIYLYFSASVITCYKKGFKKVDSLLCNM